MFQIQCKLSTWADIKYGNITRPTLRDMKRWPITENKRGQITTQNEQRVTYYLVDGKPITRISEPI